MIDVCICSHNPRRDILDLSLRSVEHQSAGPTQFRLVLIDNASTPPLPECLLDPVRRAGIDARIVREDIKGIARARLRAIRETDEEWLLFLDDDNEPFRDYIEQGTAFAARHPWVGCFGGKLLLPKTQRTAEWARPFLPYLAIKDLGEEVLIGKSPNWEPWEPPTAGAFVRRCVLNQYRSRTEADPTVFRLGRTGTKGLSSCEDSLIMRSAFALDLANAYNPALLLYHHIDSSRLSFRYLIRLMHAYGGSHVILESLLKKDAFIPEYYLQSKEFTQLLWTSFQNGRRQSWPFALGMLAYHWGMRSEHFRRRANLTT